MPGSLHATEFFLQVLDLVSDARRQLELQLRGRHVHLIAELCDEVAQVTGRHRRQARPILP